MHPLLSRYVARNRRARAIEARRDIYLAAAERSASLAAARPSQALLAAALLHASAARAAAALRLRGVRP